MPTSASSAHPGRTGKAGAGCFVWEVLLLSEVSSALHFRMCLNLPRFRQTASTPEAHMALFLHSAGVMWRTEASSSQAESLQEQQQQQRAAQQRQQPVALGRRRSCSSSAAPDAEFAVAEFACCCILGKMDSRAAAYLCPLILHNWCCGHCPRHSFGHNTGHPPRHNSTATCIVSAGPRLTLYTHRARSR